MEQSLAAIWQTVLRTNEIGIHDSFFDLGGDSLLLLQAHTKVREKLRREISIIEMFQYPTISALAGYLTQSEGAQSMQKGHERAAVRREFSQRRRNIKTARV